jgi:hypothetical protein
MSRSTTFAFHINFSQTPYLNEKLAQLSFLLGQPKRKRFLGAQQDLFSAYATAHRGRIFDARAEADFA